MSTVTVTFCTLLSGRPAAAAPVSPFGSRLQAGKVAAVALPCFQRKSRPLSVCFASTKGEHSPKTDLHPFNISPVALLNPVSQPEERWQLEEEADAVTLRFEVPGLSNEDLIVEIDEDVLIIKRKAMAEPDIAVQRAGVRTAPKGKVEAAYNAGIYARLLVPAGYKRESVEAELDSGVLTVKIFKVKEHARRRINVDIQVK